ncbi:C-22 sterol desaturase [Coprinopsis marcescibilis]|uniref:sterol 22-desaturase n=1 Tax=Coprinopsis marcescibilis TaxID=230819 RepID=A0A5C3LCB4_COPMA|nr:C-22 sterol desaturase [Coprinopsis marcescibilis]
MVLKLLSRSPLASIPSSTASATHDINAGSLIPSLNRKSATWFYTTVVIVASLLVLEQAVYRYKKRHLPGASWTIPIIGKFADSVSPTLDKYKSQWNSGVLSAVSVFNIFIVMAADNQHARKILNSPTFTEPCLVHSAKQVLVFLNGRAHVEYRKGLNHLFTRRALSIYVAIQETIARQHIAEWLETAKDGKAQAIMMIARFLNMDTSLHVFCGNHLPDEAAREINDKYWLITQSLELVNFPLALPGTKVYKAIQARKAAMRWLELAAKRSKIAMAEGKEPKCMLDEWVTILADPNYKGRTEFSDREMAMVLLSFLFASQDAMSSGLIYAFQHLADHPEVMAKVREEQERVRQGNYETPLTLETLDQMPYLNAVVKESMRVKPPVVMVPYVATKAFPISDDYTVPAGSMVIPAFYDSLHDPSVYYEPDNFLPERWLDATGAANANPKNYLVFGSGPHRCIGIDYACMNIALVLATATAMMNWEHEITPQSEEVEIIATLFPKDGCRLKLSRNN